MVHGPGLGQRDAVCVLTHDRTFGVPALVAEIIATRTGRAAPSPPDTERPRH